MPWVKLDDHFDDSDGIDNMSTDAIALHLCATTWSSRNLTDGFIPEARVKKLPGGTADALVELCAGDKPWWIKVANGYQVRSFLKYNPSGKEVRDYRQEVSSARSEAGRKGGIAAQAKRRGDLKSEANQANIEAKVEANDQAKVEETDTFCLSKNEAPYPVSRIPYPDTLIPIPDASQDAWKSFCANYPSRSGGLNKAKAEEKFHKLHADHAAILEGVQRYRRWCDANQRTGTSYVAMMTTWLNGRRWLEDYSLDESPESPSPEISQDVIAEAKRLMESGGLYAS